MALQSFLRFQVLALFISTSAIAQVVTPYTTFDCSKEIFGGIYTSCTPDDLTVCCAIGSSCCAGGCCGVTETCINKGTADEGCCPVADSSFCGYYTGRGSNPSRYQDVFCVSSDGLRSYYCPPGAQCGFQNNCIGGSNIPPAESPSLSPSSSPKPSPTPSTSSMEEEEPETTPEPSTVFVSDTSTPQPSTVTVVQSSSERDEETLVTTPNRNTDNPTVTVTQSSTSTPGAAARGSDINRVGLFIIGSWMGISILFM